MITSFLLAALFSAPEAAQNPLVSEFMASNQGALLDEDGDSSDWIEIHNPGPGALDLGGYCLSDDPNDLARWSFPSPTMLAAGDSLVVFASDKDRAVSGQELHTDFKLSAGGEYLALTMPDGVTVAHDYAPAFPQQYEDTSYGLRFQFGPSNQESYFTLPTPGTTNGIGGPLILEADHSPQFPTDTDDVTVSVLIDGATVAVSSATLFARVEYGPEISISMADDGVAPDVVADDGVWTAMIPAAAASAGQMLRWRVQAQDAQSAVGAAPLHFTSESAEYFGTVIQDPPAVSELPTIYWFLQNPSQAETRNGTRCSLWYNGEFYDNLFCRIRGGSTSSYPKKSYKFDFNPGEKFRWDPEVGRMEEINLNSTWSDKAYIRQHLSWEMYDRVGAPHSLSGMVHLRQNGAFRGMYNFVEQVDEDMLERLDMDPEGALYKMYNPVTSSTSSVEKKTRTFEGNQDLQDLVNGVALSGTALDTFMFDNVDLPAVVSYLVATSIIHDNDHVQKNYYLYRDTEGDEEWMFLPWDKDLTWGRNYTLGGGVLNDTIWAHRDPQSHPLFGDQSHPKIDGPWNRFIDACYRDPRILAMYKRRLWSVMEQELQDPNTPQQERLIEQRMAILEQELAQDVALDVGAWGSPSWGSSRTFSQGLDQIRLTYLPNRRVHFFQTHTQNGFLPGPPTTTPTMLLGAMEPDPASGDDDEEWLELQNPTADAVDLSGWSLTGGIDFDFAPGTVVPAGESVFLSPDLGDFRDRSVSPKGGERLYVVGPYDGNLQLGESLYLWNREGALVTSNSNSFVLFASEMEEGGDLVMSLAGASSQATAYIAWSIRGSGPTQTPWGVFSLSQPITAFPALSTTSAGTASLSLAVPSGSFGMQLWLQALDLSTGSISNGVTRTVD
ncbi:MAG: CotH kinase family protein [Planctomycetota bacterium]